MEALKTEIPGILIIKPNIFKDERGSFFETFNEGLYKKFGITEHFKQDNQSISKKNVLRGLHFQNPPFEQGKLLRVIRGAVLDVVVDIRNGSPFYGKHFSINLSSDNNTVLWVPAGFAHGFVSLEDDTIFSYKCTNVYNKESEGAICWDDEILNINWNVQAPIVSGKDKEAECFRNFKSKFDYKPELTIK